MAGDSKKLQPIVVKRVRKSSHAAHGGAWKIAYADFVTAMMAFFLLMWLLGSTTEGDRKGIADYFANPVRVSLSGGQGSGDTTSLVTGGGQDLAHASGQARRGEARAQRRSTEVESFRQEQRRAEGERLKALQRKVVERIQASERLSQLGSQLLLEMTADGLRIQIVDAAQRPLFASASAAPQPYLRELLRELGALLAEVPNRLTLEGHTDAMPFGAAAAAPAAGAAADAQRGYGNWELSAERANAARRELIAGGLPDDQVLRVQGLAAVVPFDRADATAAANRRIAIVVMTRQAEEELFRGSAPVAAETAPAAAQVAAPPSR